MKMLASTFRIMMMLTVMLIFEAVAISVLACDTKAGQQIFEKNCMACHGKTGKPNIVGMPDFSKGERMDKPIEALILSIKNGVSKTMMPAWDKKLKEDEILSVLYYIRSLKPPTSDPAPNIEKKKADIHKTPLITSGVFSLFNLPLTV